MRKVIRIPEFEEEGVKDPVEFTHLLDSTNGWEESDVTPNDFKQVIYLGKCMYDGDMFAGYDDDLIMIFKGHLNSGEY